MIEEDIMKKGQAICERFFRAGFGGAEEVASDVLVHRNPVKNEDGVYDFDSTLCAFSFASPYVLRRLLSLQSNLVTDIRNKYNSGTLRGGDGGNEFELLCSHRLKNSDVQFLAQPLTDGLIKVKFPPKQVLALNWHELNLESGDSSADQN